MALNPQLSATAAAVAADAVCALLNGGTLRLYDGTQPATADTAITTQALLAEMTFANPAFAAAVAGVATAHAITADADANASGTSTWFRALTSGAATVLDGSVGTADTDCVVSSADLIHHGSVAITSCVVTVALN